MIVNFRKPVLWGLLFSLLCGGILAVSSPGNWLVNWLLFPTLTGIGLYVVYRGWSWAGGGRALAWILFLAFIARIGFGLASTLLLPEFGHDSPTQNAGYFFFDAFRRDAQAWDLAISDRSLTYAFNKSYSADQYGGLLALSAGLYRFLSPDFHRTLLVAAFVSAIGVLFFYRVLAISFKQSVAVAASWIFALYPESVITGGSQMREPFLIAFMAVTFWGTVAWQRRLSARPWFWIGLGMLGILLVSPGIAMVTVLVLGGWVLLEGDRKRMAGKKLVIGFGLVAIFGLVLFALGATRQAALSGSPLAVLADWFREVVKWDVYQLERGSGWVQKLFDEMNPRWHLLFVMGYGVAQPVLPAIFVEPTTIFWRVVGIWRALGWYLLVPLLLFGFLAAWKTEDSIQRRQLFWLGGVSVLWILLVAIRGGGDQWDNPRYRVIMIVWQALFTGYAWVWWRKSRPPWLGRIVAMELVFVGFFGYWYASRYFRWTARIEFGAMVTWIVILSAVILLGGVGLDRWSGRRRA